MNRYNKLNFLRALKYIKENGPDSPEFGICENTQNYCIIELSDYDIDCYTLTNDYSRHWPLTSGGGSYPIPSTICDLDAQECFDYYFYNIGNMWDKDTEYGRLRWELLDYLIEAVKADLKSEGE